MVKAEYIFMGTRHYKTFDAVADLEKFFKQYGCCRLIKYWVVE